MADDSIIAGFIDELTWKEPRDRALAAARLRTLGQGANAVIPHLTAAALKDPDVQVRVAAAWALGSVNAEAAVPTLIEALGDTEGYVCSVAAETLKDIGLGAVSSLVKALTHHDGWLRSWAALTLGLMGPAAAKAVPALIDAAADADPRVRVEAVGALNTIQPGGDPRIPILVKELLAGPETSRYRAAYHLGNLGPKATVAIEALMKVFHDTSRAVREHAAEALKQIEHG